MSGDPCIMVIITCLPSVTYKRQQMHEYLPPKYLSWPTFSPVIGKPMPIPDSTLTINRTRTPFNGGMERTCCKTKLLTTFKINKQTNKLEVYKFVSQMYQLVSIYCPSPVCMLWDSALQLNLLLIGSSSCLSQSYNQHKLHLRLIPIWKRVKNTHRL